MTTRFITMEIAYSLDDDGEGNYQLDDIINGIAETGFPVVVVSSNDVVPNHPVLWGEYYGLETQE